MLLPEGPSVCARGGACVSALDYAARADRAERFCAIGASVWFGGSLPRCLVELGPPAWRPIQCSP